MVTLDSISSFIGKFDNDHVIGGRQKDGIGFAL
jgi:hypothetical protein